MNHLQTTIGAISSASQTEAPKVLIGERDGIVAADLEALFQHWGFQRPRLVKNLDEMFHLSDIESFDMVVVDENIHEYPNFLQTLRRLLGSMKGRVVFFVGFRGPPGFQTPCFWTAPFTRCPSPSTTMNSSLSPPRP